MSFPLTRPRRLRATPALRAIVRETRLRVDDLIAPLFVVPGSNVNQEISSLPGQNHLSVDQLADKARQLQDLGIKGVLLFGIPETKDEIGSSSWSDTGIIQQAQRALREATSDLLIIPDLCFCEYTSHGHCGVMKDGTLQNDETLENLVRQALSLAKHGADMIAPSGMLDGMIGALRKGLDSEGYTDVSLMSYAAKFASAFYGPFREAVQSAPEYGDRKTYQMDPANAREAIREVALDIEEGADIVMVKPALAFLDIIREVKDTFDMPTAAYNVSGEYAMIKAAAAKGWIDETKVMYESLMSIKRAGADIILTYFAEDFAKLEQRGGVEAIL